MGGGVKCNSEKTTVLFSILISFVLFFFLHHHPSLATSPSSAVKNKNKTGYFAHCDDTSNCDRALCNDKRSFSPVECHGHVEQAECFRNCRDPDGLATCFQEREKNSTQEYCLLKYQRSVLQGPQLDNFTLHDGLPCSIKCLADPTFWSCVHRCDRRGCFKSFRRCEREGNSSHPVACDKNLHNYWQFEECKKCYVKNLIQEVSVHGDCKLRYSTVETGLEDDPEIQLSVVDKVPRCVFDTSAYSEPKLPDSESVIYKFIEGCVNETLQLRLKKDVRSIETCFRKRLMHKQIQECQQEDSEFTPQCRANLSSSKPCFDRCLQLLTKPYCHIPCPRSSSLEDCQTHCNTKYPVFKCLCGLANGTEDTTFLLDENKQRINNYVQSAKACMKVTDSQKCYADKIHVMKPAPPKEETGNSSSTDKGLRKRRRRQADEGDEIKSGDDVSEPTATTADGNANGTKAVDEDAKAKEETKEDADKRVIAEIKTRNCKSSRHAQEFAKNLVEMFNNTQTALKLPEVKSRLGTDMGELVDHYTYLECKELECSLVPDNDLSHCVHKCIQKEKQPEEMNKVCDEIESNGNETEEEDSKNIANFLRSEIILWCMLHVGSQDPRNWTFAFYAQAPIRDYRKFEQMLRCETSARNKTGGYMDMSVFTTIANLTYLLESEWCKGCLHASVNKTYHTNELDHAKCMLNECYRPAMKRSCPKLKSSRDVIRTVTSTQCGWKIDYSLSRNPYKIWRTYFDEIPPHDETKYLQHPNTEKYLLRTNLTSTEGNFVFPYFIVLRGFCESGYYDDDVYKFIASGATPVVRLSFLPIGSRQKVVSFLSTTFQSALINLERTDLEDDLYIPKNPMNRKNETTGVYDGKLGCHLDLCYPAFVVPQTLLHIPSFEIVVLTQQSFSSLTATGYTSTLHTRDVSGIGSLKLADRRDPPTANYFFPNLKVQVYEDTQFADLWNRIPDSGYVQNASGAPAGPEIGHITDVNCKPYKTQHTLTLGGNENLPLDSEDFMRIQYTHGTAPQVVISGFHDPNLVIIGDPNLETFQLARWNFEATSGTVDNPTARLFHGRYSCLTSQYKVGGYPKPMYSMFDRSDPDYWLHFYRMRYSIKNYENPAEAKAIFEAITLEDRILLLTTGGVVSLYQNSNITSSLGKAWEVEGDDSLERCFKIFRSARRSHPQGDTIVGITYDYQAHDKHDNTIKDINQQIWVGRYTEAGVPIKWWEITSGGSTVISKEERLFNIGGHRLGTAEELPAQKIMEIPVERRETAPKSQIEAICYKAYRSNMAKASYIELIEDNGWCNAVDATPVTAVGSVIQVLVRMRAYYSGGLSGNEADEDTNVRRVVVFYVIASFAFEKSTTQSINWQIDSIIPRIPCLDEHNESIPSVVPFSMDYFRQGTSKDGQHQGCHTIEKNLGEENRIYLHGMTYTRSYNRHLFLYGNKLLQSTDGAQTFIHLKSFPIRGDTYPNKYMCKNSNAAYHRIKLMAFDDVGHYAFLTNKRELWYGNLGSLHQIRLRPGDAHSMVSTYIPELKEITDAVPFAVFFDGKNDLNEMVAVVNTNGSVIRIAKRPANEREILRASFLLKRIAILGRKKQEALKVDLAKPEAEIGSRLMRAIHFNPVDWSVFCPYASPAFKHNFSERHARTQKFFFPSPLQHLRLGIAHTQTSLLTFQTISFALVWKSVFQEFDRAYSYLEDGLLMMSAIMPFSPTSVNFGMEI